MATELIGIGGMAPELKQTYDRRLLMRVRPELVFNKYGYKRGIPGRGGKSIEFRRMEAIPGATTALTEGTPPAETNATFVTVAATISQYGQFSRISDLTEKQSFDPVVAEYVDNYAEAMKDSMEILTRNIIDAGTTVQYASTAASRGGIASGMRLTLAELREAVATLKNNNARRISGRYVGIINPDSWYDLLSDSNVLNVLQYSKDRGESNPLTTGETFDIVGVRLMETSNARVFTSLGLSGADVYSTLVFGDQWYAVIDLDSMPGKTYVIPSDHEDKNDPLNQYGTVGYKFAHAAVILNQNFGVRIEHTSSQGAVG